MQITRSGQFLSVLKECGYTVEKGASILDFGCGAGGLVAEFCEARFDAYGCDLAFKDGPYVAGLRESGHIRLIDRADYRLPFHDHMFDVVVSDQVFEHVQDYGKALCEIRRVLKTNGVTMHVFPSRYVPIEPHVKVPFATILQSKFWLTLWAIVGVRSASQKGFSAAKVSRENHRYLTGLTNYLLKARIRQEFSQVFGKVEFAEHAFLKYSRHGKPAYALSRWLPIAARIYSSCWSRVVVAGDPIEVQRCSDRPVS